MIEKLKEIEKNMIDLLREDGWQSLDIDYHPPHVERVWKQIDDEHRISLHVIHPCERKEAMVHPHPWRSAIRVLKTDGKLGLPFSGVYEHGIGFNNKEYPHYEDNYEIVCVQQVSGGMYYEMSDPNGVHYVRPIERPVYSVMLSSKVEWPVNETDPQKELKPLTDIRKSEIINLFKEFYY